MGHEASHELWGHLIEGPIEFVLFLFDTCAEGVIALKVEHDDKQLLFDPHEGCVGSGLHLPVSLKLSSPKTSPCSSPVGRVKEMRGPSTNRTLKTPDNWPVQLFISISILGLTVASLG